MDARLTIGATVLAIATASVATARTPCNSPIVAEERLREWSQNIAVISSGDQTGLGLVVGWTSGKAWIAAPAHVIYGGGSTAAGRNAAYLAAVQDQSFRAGLSVRFIGNSVARRLCADDLRPPQSLFGEPPQSLDLTFVCVEWQRPPMFNTGLLARSVSPGDELVLAYFGREEDKRGRLKAVLAAVDSHGGDVLAATPSGEAGLSGALAVNPAGAVGLYLGMDTDRLILSLATIRKAALVAQIPWQLEDSEFYDCTLKRTVCATIDRGVLPTAVTLRDVYGSEVFSLPVNECTAVPEGKYEIKPTPSEITCEPRNVVLYAQPDHLPLALHCAVSLAGAWRAKGKVELTCIDMGIGSAQCGGLAALGLGFFQGQLHVDDSGRHISLSGYFSDAVSGNPRNASGSLTWRAGHLSGEVGLTNGSLAPVELAREEEP